MPRLTKCQWLKCAFVSGCVLMCHTGWAAPPTPVLQYQFNSTGSVQTSTGSDTLSLTTYQGSTATDMVSGSPTGPSGQSGDLSLNLGNVSNVGCGVSGSIGSNDPLNSLSAFTVTAWIKDTAPAASAEYIFDLGNGGNAIAFALADNVAAGQSQEYAKVDGSSAVYAPFNLPLVTNQWSFIGVTYTYKSSSSGTVSFYYGTDVAGSALTSGSQSFSEGAVNGPNTVFDIGNTNKNGALQLQGAEDDVQLFNSALSSTDMGTERDQDLPEPASTSILAAGMLLFTRSLLRRR